MSNSYLAKHYAKLILPLKPQVLTEQENAFIQTLLPEHGNILDIGAGAGRHLIPLAAMGYNLVGVESNEEMFLELENNLEAVKNKNISDAKLFLGNINSTNFRKELFLSYGNNFDLIILMWNTLNEVAYNKNELEDFLYYCTSLLKPTGKLLIQLDQNTISNPEILNFETIYEDKAEFKKYKYTSRLKSWDIEHHISVCEEVLQISEMPRTGNSPQAVADTAQSLILEEITGEVRQKWWNKDEVIATAKDISELQKRIRIIA